MFLSSRTAYIIGASALALQVAAAQSTIDQDQDSQASQQQMTCGCGHHAMQRQSTGLRSSSQRQQNRANLSNAAVSLLGNSEQAQNALANGDRQTAINRIDQALQEASRARNLASAQGQGNVIPIFTEYAQSSVIGPIAARHTAQGVQAAGAPVVRNVRGQFTQIALDVPMAEQHLQAARSALLNNNLGAANSALNAVQDGVIMVRVESDLPLVQARQNLALARSAVNRGDFQAARLPLREAINALGQYSGSHERQAERLQLQIASLANNLPGNQQSDLNRINQWWNELADWTGTAPQQQPQQQQIG